MKTISSRTAAWALAALAVVAAPAAVSAHPGIYSVTAKLARAPERQTITIDATGGTFKPSAGAPAVAFDAPAYAVEAALGADPAIGADAAGTANVLVTGPAAGVFTLTYQGSKAAIDVPEVVPDGSALTGGAATATAATITSGGGANIVYPADPATMTDQTQYLIANDGYSLGFKETNGLDGSGMLNLKLSPTAYRAPQTFPQWITFPFTQTGVQPHATCQGVAALADPVNIKTWQNDPFYNYIPWQKTSAAFHGLGDDHTGPGGPTGPGGWVEVVKTITNGLAGAPAGGVDLSTLTTVADFTAACSALGGTYVPADTASDPVGTEVADLTTAATAPLNAQITTLQGQVAALTADKTTLQGQVDSLTNRPLRLTLATPHFAPGLGTAMVTGRVGDAVTIRILLATSAASRLHLGSPVIAAATRTIGSQGAVIVTPKPATSVLRKLAKRKSASKVTIEVVAGGVTITKTATLL